MIQVDHLYKSYNSHSKQNFAVQDISFSVVPGKITGLLGPNGSGKTTIMKAICGFHYATDGKITVSEIDVSTNPELVMEKIGYVPEVSVLPLEMTVIDFLEYVCKIHFVQNPEEQIDKVVKECQLQKFINKKIKKLSKGQKQRVSFAQCLVYNPENLILDEPVSGLDPAQIQEMRSLIKNLSKDKSILLSTHILQEVSSLCDNILILNNGKIVASGTEQDISKNNNSKNLEEAFIKLTKEAE